MLRRPYRSTPTLSWKVSLSLSVLTGIFSIIALVLNAQNTHTPRRRSNLANTHHTPDPILYPQKSGPREQTSAHLGLPTLLTSSPDTPLSLDLQKAIDKEISIIERWDGGVISIKRINELRKDQEPEIIKIIHSHHRLDAPQLERLRSFLTELRIQQVKALTSRFSKPLSTNGKYYQPVNATAIRHILLPQHWMNIPEDPTDPLSRKRLKDTLQHANHVRNGSFTESQYRFFRLNTHLSRK